MIPQTTTGPALPDARDERADAEIRLPPRGDMRSLQREHGFVPLEVEGTIPEGLAGTLFRVGPGLYDTFGRAVQHSFEADGSVCGFRIEGGRVLGAQRVIESEGLAAERRAGRPLYGERASRLTRIKNALRFDRKNVANTALLEWQGRLFGLVESAAPTELDPEDLSTLGETRLGGAIGRAFTAHPHRVHARRAIYGFGMRWGPGAEPPECVLGPRSAIELQRLPDHGPAEAIGEIPLEHGPLLHDFCATPKHLVFLVPPIRLRLARAMLGIVSDSGIFGWHPDDGTEVIVVPIDRPREIVRFRVDPFFQWHFAGAWDEGDRIVLHVARFPDFGSYEGLRKTGVTDLARLHRVTIDPLRRSFSSEPIAGARCEFPKIDPRYEGERYRHVLVSTASGEHRGIARLDVERGIEERYLFPFGSCPSETLLVPRDRGAREGEGWALTVVYEPDRDTSCLAIFDAERLSAGPLARAWMPEHIPMTFHGLWSPFTSPGHLPRTPRDRDSA